MTIGPIANWIGGQVANLSYRYSANRAVGEIANLSNKSGTTSGASAGRQGERRPPKATYVCRGD